MKESEEVTALYAGVERVLNMLTSSMRGVGGRQVGDCKHGVYLFYDYDGEPIYVGRTKEQLRTRIRRHLTNQRTDAVAMRVLDPFEVAEIEMWPFWTLYGKPLGVIDDTLDRAEYTVYQNALKTSTFSRILNEKEIAEKPAIELPPSFRGSILEGSARNSRSHPDVRLARRARTIAELARIISERKVNIGLRNTLLSQAVRLEHLARTRLEQIARGKNT
ncbi:MAG: GIY-YIG nuclease family protein [Deltaproteobacteria bacterium]|nr:GIY-YIG nuclease family protein [bacterium]MDE0344050.1 GIY-YIG nuclease family protein [Deltaproteobacteria bacterium]